MDLLAMIIIKCLITEYFLIAKSQSQHKSVLTHIAFGDDDDEMMIRF